MQMYLCLRMVNWAQQMLSHIKSIQLGDSPPIKQLTKCIPFALHRKVEEVVDDMLQKQVIHPSKSHWASPVVLVAKRNVDTRFCAKIEFSYKDQMKDGCLSSTQN